MGEKNIEVIRCSWAGRTWADGAPGGWSLQREEVGKAWDFGDPCHQAQH